MGINAELVLNAQAGIGYGAAIAIVPVAVTSLIAASPLILINVIANIALRILSGGRFGIEIYKSNAFLKVPFLWKISYYSAILGGAIIGLSLVTLAVNYVYLKVFSHEKGA